MGARIYKNTTGLCIKVNMQRDITAAANYKLNVRKPSGEMTEWIPTIGDSRRFYYYTQTGDLDETGIFIIQPYMSLGGWTGPGTPARFTVVNPIF